MKPVLFLHIGMNKTGSTALQVYMSKHYGEHLKQGVLYPSAGRKGVTHYLLSTAFGLGSNKHLRHKYNLEQILEEMVREGRKKGTDHYVVSSETFIVCRDPKLLNAALSSRFDVKIVIYLRRHDEWIESLYNQAVKMVVTPPWGMGVANYLEHQRNRGEGAIYFRYWDLLECWSDAFGRENISVRPFERQQFVNNDLIQDFLSVVGVDSSQYDVRTLKRGDSNISLSADRLSLVDSLQHARFFSPRIKRLIVKLVARVPTRRVRKYVLSPDERKQLVAENQHDYVRIARAYLGREDLFVSPLDAENENWQPPEKTWLGSLGRLLVDRVYFFFMRSNAMFDQVIVYQMGKVGSTSIVNSLNAAGVDAHQSHFLDSPTFHEMLDRIIGSRIGEEAARHMSTQLQQNLLLANGLARAMENEQNPTKGIGIITLVRDPLDWFYSNLSQNYFTYEGMLKKWLLATGKLNQDQSIEKEHLLLFVSEIIGQFDALVAGIDSSSIEAIQGAFRAANKTEEGQTYRFIYGQATGLLRPHFWFDKHFNGLFGVDVLGSKVSAGQVFRNETGKLRILLLRFEELADCSGAVGAFCGINGFSLTRANESKNKRLGRLFSEVRNEIEYPAGFLDKIYASDYARKFYPKGRNS